MKAPNLDSYDNMPIKAKRWERKQARRKAMLRLIAAGIYNASVFNIEPSLDESCDWDGESY